MRILVLTQQGRAQGANLCETFRANKGGLRRRLGARFSCRSGVPLDRVEAEVRSSGADVALMAFGWDEPVERLVSVLRPLYEASRRPRLAFLDWYDQTSTPHFAVLPYVEAYIKPQMLRDHSWYREDLVGGYAVTDFLAREMGVATDDFQFGSVPDPVYAHRIVLGWNLGAAAGFRRRLQLGRFQSKRWERRGIDVQARLGMGPRAESWYAVHRRAAQEAISGLRGEFDVRSDGVLPRREYMRELRDSKVVVSPFGWGEVCFRDFDAVSRGALLVKPAMSHLETSPDIFVPYETYVPVRWDMADLERACRFYLQHPREAVRIVRNAQEAYLAYFRKGGMVDDLARVLRRIESPAAPTPTRSEAPPPWRVGAHHVEADFLAAARDS